MYTTTTGMKEYIYTGWNVRYWITDIPGNKVRLKISKDKKWEIGKFGNVKNIKITSSSVGYLLL